MMLSRVVTAAGALALAMTVAPSVWAGEYQGKDETKEYRQPCPACPTCPPCATEVREEDTTWLRAEIKGGALVPVGHKTTNRIDWGGMVEPTFGVKVWDDLDVEVSYLFSNVGVSNPDRNSGSQDFHCFRGGPRINGDVGPIVELYGTIKAGYCLADGSSTGFTDNNFVVGPGGGAAFSVTPNLQLTVGTDLIWFTGHNVTENTVITPNAGVRFKF
jgi:hypothetical protein